ncbi:MAG TPA: aldehyde dehydrogenase family protein [Aestuariivirgaceae bacterium]|nr:aldehyde dehydrogenase family protein [Aestuariivirgaceae bacterium]
MTKTLPRVTYSNVNADFEPLHAFIDRALPEFRRAMLGRAWPNVVAGRQDVSGRAYEVHAPFDRELLVARLVAADKKAVEGAVSSAKAAFPAWAALDWQERVRIVRRWAAEVDKRKYDLAFAALYEVGKSRLEAVGEAEEAVDLLAWYCDEMERNKGFVQQMKRAVPNEETICALRPVGVFAVIAPFNFPIALPCNMLGACLIAGNAAVFKPSPGAGLTAALLVEAADAAGMPDGVLNMLCGEEAGRLLVENDEVGGIAFTGSHEVGMKIFRRLAAGSFAKPLICEMGGKNPAYVTAKADLDVAAEGIARSAFGLQGEKCSACSVAYVDRGIMSPFLERLTEKTLGLKVGNPEDRAVFVGPVIDEAALERFEKAVKAAKAGGRIVAGGERIRTGPCAKGLFVQPTVVTELPPEHWINGEELFLPFLSVQGMASLAEGIARGNAVIYGLTAGIYTQDERELDQFRGSAQAGVLYANRRSGATTGAWPGFQTFCGWKGSGVDGKGGLGPHTIPRYMREQSLTLMRSPR